MNRAFISFLLASSLANAQQIAQDSIARGRWTKAEQKQYQACVAADHSEKEYLACVASGQKNCIPLGRPEMWCEVAEEGKHWLRIRHKLAKDSDHAKFHKCSKEHETEMNGTPQQFYAAFDLCMRQAYGLPISK